MSFCAGQTYLFPLDDENRTEHLWLIATEPNSDGEFVTVSFTSLKGAKDKTVILQKAEHPFLKWDTCILYAQAEISTVEKLQLYLDNGHSRMHKDVSRELLSLIFDGLLASDRTKNRVRDFVRKYKLARVQTV